MKKYKLDWNLYREKAIEAVSEGIVLLENRNNSLPLKQGENIAIFGRIQFNYYKSGTGSGGMVNVDKIVGITDALLDEGFVNINEKMLNIYKEWISENPFDLGKGWGNEPWSQVEMPLEDSLLREISGESSTALVIIGRTAGEEQDATAGKGSYLLSDAEEEMLSKVRNNFKKMIVLLNVGSIIDMSFVDKYSPDSVLYVWQGGMIGGIGTAKVLTGKVNPSGRLTDTLAYNVTDYSSNKNFGDVKRNFYAEDIFVGYRYFETFARDKVRYPFGYGLSYTLFTTNLLSFTNEMNTLTLKFSVKNIGERAGKEVVQIYCQAPQGKLGKPARVLCGFAKTNLLDIEEEQLVTITIKPNQYASYDDTGITGNKSSFVLEEGEYKFYAGSDVRSAKLVSNLILPDTIFVSRHIEALTPVLPFERMHVKTFNGELCLDMEHSPCKEPSESERRMQNLPNEIKQTGNLSINLGNVLYGENTMDEFIAQLSDDDLACIIRGEGMSSPKVTLGTASAFGGVTDSLKKMGIPCCCCADGPSGIRMDCGTKAFSLPNGTMLASTFNTKLITELYTFLGLEMIKNKIDCILGPGMNIHRHPLNGRNFEYFSEDPFLTGSMAIAELNGLHSVGVEGSIKHFCGNNQELGRRASDSVISERALREIYLKGFEMAVKEGDAKSIMTTYGAVNGLWTASNYDLTTTILHNDWGYNGFTMTDWWAHLNERNQERDDKNLAAMARAQNDVYMVCSSAEGNIDNIKECLDNGTLLRSELQRNAKNICEFILNTHAMKRMIGEEESVEVVNFDGESSQMESNNVKSYKVDREILLDIDGINTNRGSEFSFCLDVTHAGFYEMSITASSDLSELAQLPVTIFTMGTASDTITFQGSENKVVTKSGTISLLSRLYPIRLFFAQTGLKIHKIELKLIKSHNE